MKVEGGLLIAFEGVDGAGKTSQVKRLARWLTGIGYQVVISKWNSSELVKGAIKRAKKKRILTPETYSKIHALDLLDRWIRVIQPALTKKKIVICDRFVFTGYARDAARGLYHNDIRTNYITPYQDLTFFFNIHPQQAVNRKKKIKFYEAGLDILEGRTDKRKAFVEFQTRVYIEYQKIMETTSSPVEIIDATKDKNSIEMLIRKIIKCKLGMIKPLCNEEVVS